MATLTFDLYLKEPVLVSAPGGDPNTNETNPFIPGSALRGALAAAWLRAAGAGADQTPAFVDRFLTGETRYLNGYLKAWERDKHPHRLLPAPRNLVIVKDKPKDGEYAGVLDLSKPQDEKSTNSLKGFLFYSALESGTLLSKEIEFETKIHTARNRELGRAVEGDNDSALFRYRGLASRQTFSAAIQTPDLSIAQDLHKLLEDNQELLLGGSNSAGYGLVNVENLTLIKDDSWREMRTPLQAVAQGDLVSIYLSSDMIVRDQHSGALSHDLLPHLGPLAQKLALSERFVRTGWAGGFNTKWGLPLPQDRVLLMGSLFVYKALDQITASEMSALEQQGIGERLAEGYGQVSFQPDWQQEPKLRTRKLKEGEGESSQTSALPNLSVDDQLIVNRINRSILERDLERRMLAAVGSEDTKINSRLSKSQVHQLRLLIREIDPAAEAPFKELIDFLNGTKKRKVVDQQYRKSSITLLNKKRVNLRAWMLDLADEPSKVWDYLRTSGLRRRDTLYTRHLLGGPNPRDKTERSRLEAEAKERLAQRAAPRFLQIVVEQLAAERQGEGR